MEYFDYGSKDRFEIFCFFLEQVRFKLFIFALRIRCDKRIPNLDAHADPNNSIGLAWCARFLLRLADFSKNMKSLIITYSSLANCVRRSWQSEMVCSLTIRKTAARSVTLHLTSRSFGKVTPKLSASVNASFSNADHFFVIRPIFVPSFVKILSLLTQHK